MKKNILKIFLIFFTIYFKKNCFCQNYKHIDSVTLIQTISDKGKKSIENGGYTKTLTTKELFNKLKEYHSSLSYSKNKQCKEKIFIGIGGTRNFTKDVYMIDDESFMIILNENQDIKSKLISRGNYLSFAKAALLCKNKIINDNSNFIYEDINKIFNNYIPKNKIGKKYIAKIEFEAASITSMNIFPTIRGSGNNYPLALPMDVVLNGGIVVISNNSYKDIVSTQSCKDISLKKCITENKKIKSILNKKYNEAIIINKPTIKKQFNKNVTAIAIIENNNKKFKLDIISNFGRIVDAQNIRLKNILLAEVSEHLTLMPDSQKCTKDQNTLCDKSGTWSVSKEDMI